MRAVAVLGFMLIVAALASASDSRQAIHKVNRHGKQGPSSKSVFEQHKEGPLHPGSAVRQASSQQQHQTAGFSVMGISFVSACMSQGCWEIDVEYQLAPYAMSVLYLPKTNGDDSLQDGGGYPQTVSDTFEPKTFPCSLMGTGSSNACCIKEFLQSYRTTSSFEAYAADTDFSQCPDTPLSSEIVGSQSIEGNATRFLEGSLSGMTYSEIEIVEVDGLGIKAKIRLDEKEVRTLAGKIQGHTAVEYTVNVFIGMVSFTATHKEDSTFSNFMQVYHSQTLISLERKNYAQLVLNGGFSQTFLNYVGTVLHNVRITEGSHVTGNAQFIQLSFTMPEKYTVAGANGELIPFSSVRIGKGKSMSSVVEWIKPCNVNVTGNGTVIPGIYGNPEIAAVYDTFSEIECAPPAEMCLNPPIVAEEFVTYQFPLGIDFYTDDDMSSAAGTSIFLDFVVSVQDDAKKMSSSTQTIEIQLKDTGHNAWCESEEISIDLLQLSNIDIVVGTASTQQQLDTQLTVLSNVLFSSSVAKPEADSLVVLKGDDAFFQLPGAKDFYLELEDVITLHLLGTTDTKYNAVTDLLNQDLAFETVINGQASETAANLDTTSDLDEICPPDGSDLSCLSRRDVFRRAANSAQTVALELDPESTAAATSFFTTMVGSSSPWITELATKYSELLTTKYSINKRHKRAFWLNPGHNFNPSQQPPTFTMPSKMIISMLVSLNENGVTRRRAIITAGPGMAPKFHPVHASIRKHRSAVATGGHSRTRASGQGPPATFSEIGFKVNAADQLKAAAGVDVKRATTFKVEYEMPTDLLCMPEDKAKAKLGQLMLVGMQKAGDVEKVVVTSFSVPEESKLACGRRLHRMSRSLQASGTAVTIEMLVVFRTEGNMVLNEKAFIESVPGVKALVHTDTANAGKLTIDNNYVPPNLKAKEALPMGSAETADAETGGKSILNIVLGCAGVASVLGMASVVVMKKRALLGKACKAKDFNDIDAKCPSPMKDKTRSQGVRLRRSNSNEELGAEQEVGATMKRSNSADAVEKLVLVEGSTTGSIDSYDSSLNNSKVTSAFSSFKSKTSPVKGSFRDKMSFVTGSSCDTSSVDTNPQIQLNLDLIDWASFKSTTSQLAGSPDRSRSTSPLLLPGQRSPLSRASTIRGSLSPVRGPTGDHFATKNYRADLASRELRKDKLTSSFDFEEDCAPINQGSSSLSLADLKTSLRSLGATEKDILDCLQTTKTGPKHAAGRAPVTAEDIESRLFRSPSDDRSPAALPSQGM